MIHAFAFFHLNLAYSSLKVSQRAEVIRRCYHPLLDLVDSGIPLGIELTSWTLQQIAEIDPGWTERFKLLLDQRKCELIGSGYIQLIGPLVPAEVNDWNQVLGCKDYQAFLGLRPDLAMMNEMAFSEGMIDIYHRAGYKAFILEANNTQLAIGQQSEFPSRITDRHGHQMPVLWSDSMLFQKLQRYVHGECSLSEYCDYLKQRLESTDQALCLYSNDVEIFGFRPGRFETEAPLHQENEWQRLSDLFIKLHHQHVDWQLPSSLVKADTKSQAAHVTSAAYPVSVKKQLKYNVSRWAVSGRSDLLLNTFCYQLYQKIRVNSDEGEKRQLCEYWASDYRTHIETDRWHEIEQNLVNTAKSLRAEHGNLSKVKASIGERHATSTPCNDGMSVNYSHEGKVLDITTDSIHLSLNLHRGLSIRSLAFKQHDFKPLVGTQLHGYFDCITLGADFYSGNFVADYMDAPSRITDLEPVEPELLWDEEGLSVKAYCSTNQGRIHKHIRIPAHEQTLTVAIDASDLPRRSGRSRIAAMTLLTQNLAGPYWYSTVNGGYQSERFVMKDNFDQAQSVSPQVSCRNGLGATEGWVVIGGQDNAIKISWNPAECALFPMMTFTHTKPSPFVRLTFSLQETDDTFRPGGKLLPISYQITPETIE